MLLRGCSEPPLSAAPVSPVAPEAAAVTTAVADGGIEVVTPAAERRVFGGSGGGMAVAKAEVTPISSILAQGLDVRFCYSRAHFHLSQVRRSGRQGAQGSRNRSQEVAHAGAMLGLVSLPPPQPPSGVVPLVEK